MRPGLPGGLASAAVLAALALLPADPRAGTTGKLSGVVLDAKKQPLAGANVVLVGVPLGAATENDGRYLIFGVPAGTYSVKVSLIGYAATTIQSLAIPADRTTTLDVTLTESAVELKEVVVIAKRPIVELGLTSNVATITRDQIARLPVQELQQIVDLQAGVVDGHFRGGRKGEVQYQVDGISVNDPYDNTSSVKLDRSVLEEVQVISGTFDAEYGQAMSGVVNAVLKRGTEKFEWSGEVFQGDHFFPGAARPSDYRVQVGGLQNYQLSVSGPSRLPKTLFLLSSHYGVTESPFRGQRRFVQFDRSVPDSVVAVFSPPASEPIGYTREWLGLGKISNRSLPGIELSYEAIVNQIRTRRDGSSEWNWRLNLDGLPRQRTESVVQGLEMTHTLDPRTFYRLSVRNNYFDYHDWTFDNLFDPRYDEMGQAFALPGVLNEAVLTGVVDNRFRRTTRAWVFAGSVNRQFRLHAFKGGFDWEPTRVTFGHPGWLQWLGDHYLRYGDPVPGYPAPSPYDAAEGFPAPATYKPVVGSAYAQDDVEWNDLRMRAGLRLEYFNPRALVPGDPKNPANTIGGATVVTPRAASRKITLSPRLGVSFPVTPRASLFFGYGHTYQMPELGQIFANADYSLLGTLQANAGRDYGTFGNPDVKPQRTVQYQMGYKQQVKDWLGLDLTLFYKDIRDLLGSEVLVTYSDALYKRLSTGDFGNVVGATLALDQRELGIVSTSLDYTWQVAKGNASDPFETARRVDAHQDPRPRSVIFDWDQRHTLNLTVTLARPQDFNVSGVFRAASGQPYTPETEAYLIETNSARKPSAFRMDLRSEKSLRLSGYALTTFATVYNLFDARFWNGSVFADSGSPYYSRSPAAHLRDLADPTRYYGPRRVELGVRWEPGP
ncbi:MAG TPA: TonB-dependent receptor [Candidatus Eisenbacteria bacterium]|jgi:outer membrane receptor protein involved in Fe transport